MKKKSQFIFIAINIFMLNFNIFIVNADSQTINSESTLSDDTSIPEHVTQNEFLEDKGSSTPTKESTFYTTSSESFNSYEFDKEKSSENTTYNQTEQSKEFFSVSTTQSSTASFNGVTAVPNSENQKSEIVVNVENIQGVDTSKYRYQVQYYYTDNLSDMPQSTITENYNKAVTSSVYNHKEGYSRTDYSIPLTVSSSKRTLNQLFAGNYKIYARIVTFDLYQNDKPYFYTDWQSSKITTLKANISIILPTMINLNDSFTYQRTNSVLELKFNQKLYTIKNNSNQIINIKPTIMAPDSTNQVTLVSANPGTNNDKKLQLKLVSSTTTPIWNLADLTNPTILELQPYWDTTNNKKQFYFDGAYSGPIVTQNKAAVSYNLVFSMQPR